jgi:hypothetical protein
MRGFTKLDDEDIERLYGLAADLVASWSNNDNPEIQLAPMGAQILGQEAVSIDIINVRTGLKGLTEKNDAIRRLIPGADIDTEHLPNGKMRYIVNIPIWTKESKKHKKGDFIVSLSEEGRKPSTEYLMFLVMIDAILATVLFFRIN